MVNVGRFVGRAFGVGALLLGAGGVASAQEGGAGGEAVGVERRGLLPAMPGIGLQLGGGIFQSAPENAEDGTNPGGYWDVRAVFGARVPVGLELAYVGATQALAQPGDDARLYRNGAEGNLRFNIKVLDVAGQYLAPFGFAGAGWQHITTDDVNVIGALTADVRDDDDVMIIPVGAGLAYAAGPLILDARFTYRPAFFEEDEGLDAWTAGAQIGLAF